MVDLYTREYYRWLHQGSRRSAQVIVPMLLAELPVQSVVDVGCGDGTWLSTFMENGVHDVLGIDGDHVKGLQINDSQFRCCDLREPLSVDRTFDLALALEVAEHLPPERAAGFVRDLTALAPVVVFSAAIPGQGGNGHINEQFHDYWSALFRKCGYVVSDWVRPRIWNSPDVCYWYAQNLLIFHRSAPIRESSSSFAGLQIVHPILYEQVRSQGSSVRGALRLLVQAIRRRLWG